MISLILPACSQSPGPYLFIYPIQEAKTNTLGISHSKAMYTNDPKLFSQYMYRGSNVDFMGSFFSLNFFAKIKVDKKCFCLSCSHPSFYRAFSQIVPYSLLLFNKQLHYLHRRRFSIFEIVHCLRESFYCKA